MKNNALSEIGAKLRSAERILLFPHVRADGDAIGSGVALCSALRRMGKQAWVLVEDEIAENLRFLTGDFVTDDCGILGTPDVCISVDCSDAERFGTRRDVFFSAPCRICVDHHATTNSFADLNYIDPAAAATGEIVYDLLGELGAEIDSHMANALYAAIETDTGGFRYSNTTKKSHLITAALYDCGLDNSRVCNEIYDSMRAEQLALHSAALSEMTLFHEGQAGIVCVSQELLRSTGAVMAETEGIVEALRSVRDVELSALLKEEELNTIKVSLRAKSKGDVAAISQKFGGGGHKKAAGCTLRTSLQEALKVMMEAIEEELKREETC